MPTNEYMREYMARRYEERKAWAIERLGGSCTKCRSTSELQFDHIDPATKEFSIATRLAGVAMKRLLLELDKCQLLCQACHLDKSRREGSLSRKSKMYTCKYCGDEIFGNAIGGHSRWCKPRQQASVR